MTTDSSLVVAWIGAGRMGVPLGGFVVAAGYPLTVYSRSPGSRAALVAHGAAEAASVAEAVSNATVVCTSLPDDRTVLDVVAGSDGVLAAARRGAVLVETSTISLEASAELAAAAARCGVEYLRCPISGNAASARRGEVTALVSGPPAAWERVRPVVEAFSAAQVYLGAGDEARAMKLVANAMVIGTAQLLAESLALGRKLGLERDVLLDTVASTTVASPWVKAKVELLKQRDFTPTMTTRLITKDADLILGAAATSGVSMPVLAATRQLLQVLLSEGRAEEDFVMLVELAERHAGLRDPARVEGGDGGG